MGKPSEEGAIGPKENDSIVGSRMSYQVTKTDPDIANNNDLEVEFYFNTDGRLVSTMSNLQCIPTWGPPLIQRR